MKTQVQVCSLEINLQYIVPLVLQLSCLCRHLLTKVRNKQHNKCAFNGYLTNELVVLFLIVTNYNMHKQSIYIYIHIYTYLTIYIYYIYIMYNIYLTLNRGHDSLCKNISSVHKCLLSKLHFSAIS